MSNKKTIKSALESMMFTWSEPLEVKAAADVFNISKDEALEYFLELQKEYEQEGRGIVIRRINKSFQFVTREENADYVRSLCTPVKVKKLSQSALEVLAIVAYKQPVTKGEIEAILYGTTDTFLKNFGFSSIKELPEIEDIESAMSGSLADDIEDEDDQLNENQMRIEI